MEFFQGMHGRPATKSSGMCDRMESAAVKAPFCAATFLPSSTAAALTWRDEGEGAEGGRRRHTSAYACLEGKNKNKYT